MLTRRGFLKTIAGLVLGGVAAAAYGFAVEPGFRLRLARYALTPPRWPKDFKLTIAVIADPHMGGPHMPAARLENIVGRVNRLTPDLCVLLGDYVAGHRFVTTPVPVAETARILARLTAPLGTYAVMGNHDWWDDLTAQRTGKGPTVAHKAFAAAGLKVLENDAVHLGKDGRDFWLLGLGDQLAFHAPRFGRRGVDDLPATLARIKNGDPAILLAHEPDIFPEVPERVSLTLCGHTHGGQVRLFGWSPIVPSRFGNRYAYGHIVERDRHMIVSGGIGTSILPVRFGVPPEVVLVTLG
jgi:predicted MPP superfamily phosphohydrolase